MVNLTKSEIKEVENAILLNLLSVIINMSFGIYYPSASLKKYIDRAADNGIITIAAVGNDGRFKDKHRIMYPAKYENVIAVGSGSAYAVSDFSNNSSDLDFVAPGSTVSTDIKAHIQVLRVHLWRAHI